MKRYLTFLISFLILSGCKKDNPDVQWKRLNINTGITLSKVFFTNEEIGYVAGIAPLDSFYYSDSMSDNFVRAIQQPLPINDPRTFSYRKIVSTMSGKRESSCFKTYDGGNSWTGVTTPFITGVNDMDFVNGSYGFVVATEEGVYKTENGGENWDKVLGNAIFPGSGVIALAPYTNVYFINKMDGFVFSKDKDLLIYTQDGGSSWKYISSAYDKKMSIFHQGINKISFPEKDQTGYLLSGNNTIFKTTDGGASWNQIVTTMEWIEDFSFLNDKNGVYLSENHLYKTTDGGNTWNEFKYNTYSSPLGNDRIVYEDSNNLYFFNNQMESISHSDDGGSTFVKMTTDKDLFNNNNAVKDVIFTSSGTGIAVGFDGSIFKYTP